MRAQRKLLAIVITVAALATAQASQQEPKKATTSAPASSSGTQAQSDDGNPVSLEKVEDYLTADKRDRTELQDGRLKKQLVGRKYSGVVRVFDVKEAQNRVVLEYFNFPSQSQLLFSISDAKLKEIAADLKKGDRVAITAKLESLGIDDSAVHDGAYITGYRNNKVCMFDGVSSIELLPRSGDTVDWSRETFESLRKSLQR